MLYGVKYIDLLSLAHIDITEVTDPKESPAKKSKHPNPNPNPNPKVTDPKESPAKKSKHLPKLMELEQQVAEASADIRTLILTCDRTSKQMHIGNVHRFFPPIFSIVVPLFRLYEVFRFTCVFFHTIP